MINGGGDSLWKWPNFPTFNGLTKDRVILHTVMHYSLTSTYIPNFIELEEAFCGRMDGRTYVRTDWHLRPTLLGRLGGVDLMLTQVTPASCCWRCAGAALTSPRIIRLVAESGARVCCQSSRAEVRGQLDAQQHALNSILFMCYKFIISNYQHVHFPN